ncbi:MAG: hypothetical protein ACLSCE_18880 [Bacteroides cellulosilyticus]
MKIKWTSIIIASLREDKNKIAEAVIIDIDYYLHTYYGINGIEEKHKMMSWIQVIQSN